MGDSDYSAPSKYYSFYNYLFYCYYCLFKFASHRHGGCRCNAVSSILAGSGRAQLVSGAATG